MFPPLALAWLLAHKEPVRTRALIAWAQALLTASTTTKALTAAAFALLLIDRPLRFAAAIALLLGVGLDYADNQEGPVVYRSRNFFGTLTIRDNPSAGNYEELGELLMEDGRLAQARDAFDKAIGARSNTLDCFYRRGVCAVLLGNAAALNLVTNTAVTLNLQDPDSMTVDKSGNIVLDSQADNELVTIHNPGAANQSVTVLPLSDAANCFKPLSTASGIPS